MEVKEVENHHSLHFPLDFYHHCLNFPLEGWRFHLAILHFFLQTKLSPSLSYHRNIS
jgi:hypothetical protein